MPTTRDRGGVEVVSAPTAPPTSTRTRTRTPATSTRKPKELPSTDDGQLADELSRVLQISQPRAPPLSRRTAASSSSTPIPSTKTSTKSALPPVRAARTVTKVSSSASLRAGPSGAKEAARPSTSATTAPRSRAAVSSRPSESTQAQAGPSRLPATAPRARAPISFAPKSPTRPKSKAPPPNRALPEWSTDPSLSPSQRAKAALAAANAASAALVLASRAGYKPGRPIEADAGGEGWTPERIEGLVHDGRFAIGAMREIDLTGKVSNMSVAVENVSLGLVQRCLGMTMYETGLEILAEARDPILRLYAHDSPEPRLPPNEPTDILPEEWRNLLFIPRPTNPSGAEEPVRSILFQATISAWICISALRAKYKIRCSIFVVPPPPPTTSPNLDPLSLATALPHTIVVPLLNLFARLCSTISTSSPDWPVAARLTILSKALASSSIPSKDARIGTPSELWASIHEKLYLRLKEANGDVQVVQSAAAILKDVIPWIEGMVRTRKEDKKVWSTGKAYMELMDLWISIGRKLGDSGVIDEALSRMTGSTSIVPTQIEGDEPGPSTPRSSTPPSELMRPVPSRAGSSRRAVQRISDAEEAVLRYCGELTSLAVMLDKVVESPQDDICAASAQSALTNFPFFALSDALVSLTDSESGRAAFEKAGRRFEVVRRACDKILPKCAGIGKGEEAVDGLTAAIHVWSIGEVDLVEDFVQSSPIDFSAVSASLTRLSSGPIGSLFKGFTTSTLDPSIPSRIPFVYLDRIHRLTILCRPFVPIARYVEWVRCSSQSAHQYAYNLVHRAGKPADALPYAQYSVDRVRDLSEYVKMDQMSLEDRRECKIESALECLCARWETLGVIAGKIQDQAGMLEANISAISAVSPIALEKLLALSATTQYKAAWESLPHLDGLIRRLAAPIFLNPSIAVAAIDLLMGMTVRLSGTEGMLVRALLWERWFEVLERGLHVPDIAQAAMRVAEGVLGESGFQASEAPIRRMRFICRLLGVMLQTGLKAEEAPRLLDEVDNLGQIQSFGLDVNLQSSLSEYKAIALVLRTLFAHRLDSSPADNSTSTISALAARAMDELRRIILPPSPTVKAPPTPTAPIPQPRSTRTKVPLGRATTTPAPRSTTAGSKTRTVSETKTPKRSVIDSRKVSEIHTANTTSIAITPNPALPLFVDLPRLISLLSSLIALLGVLALPLQKIEGLKLARALMRSHEPLAGEYVTLSSRLGTEYARLGKWGRATAVFAQAKRCVGSVEDERRAEWGLRWAAVLAQMGKVDEARKEYQDAYALHQGLQPSNLGLRASAQIIDRAGKYERAALARVAYAAILVAEGKSTLVMPHLAASYRLYTRYMEFIAGLSPDLAPTTNGKVGKVVEDDPFGAPSAKTIDKGANQPSKDSQVAQYPAIGLLDNKLLSGVQWHATEAFLGSVFELASAYSLLGKASDVVYFLNQAKEIAILIKSPLVVARSEARLAELEGRLRKYEVSSGRMEVASAIFNNSDGPDAVESRIIHGDLLEKQESGSEALLLFKRGGEDIEGLEEGFGKKEALLPTPERPAVVKASPHKFGPKDRLLPSTLAHVLRQRLWLGRNQGMDEVERGELVRQIQALGTSSEKAEEMYLNGRLALLEVLKVFKTDLFMSSLTDSTIAMPMSTLTRRSQDRHSTRRTVNTLLARSAAAFQSALELMEHDGRLEDVRQAGMSLALLHAFQTSLGEGGDGLAVAAADLLASMSSITMRREMVDVIAAKYVDGPQDDVVWPSFGNKPLTPSADTDMDDDQEQTLRETWSSISNRLQSPSLTCSSPIDLSPLPANWAIVSISVAPDHSTMFLTRHQKDHHPLVLCLPLDRQGKREGEDNPLPFQLALDELRDIVQTSDNQARVAKNINTSSMRQEWWEARHALDTRLGELVSGMEENWLGVFKSILKPQSSVTPKKIQMLRGRMEKIFNEALAGIGTDMRRVKTVRLDDAVLACFATLDGTTNEEEVEDLVYFVLDFYGFHGIPVAIAELDIDQIGVDVKQALHDITNSHPSHPSTPPEHLLLVLDKNVQDFPWESIPVLRGKPVSRIPSLPFLLDHLELARVTSPEKGGLLSVNARKVFYLLNPSGDLARTQTQFEPWLNQMQARAGWKGIVGRPPTDLELSNALRDHDLVLYFGHGGAEQYIRSKRIKNLPNCATTFLWGCSSGLLKDQGDLDRAGTALHYMMGGCPSLIANLWDVTDRDIDRLSAEVHKKLALDPSHIARSLVPAKTPRPNGKAKLNGDVNENGHGRGQTTISTEGALLPLSQMSTVQALNASRDDCRLKFLTGAAPVVYGLPVWMF